MIENIETYVLDNYTSPDFPQKYEEFLKENYKDIVPELILGDEKLTDITNKVIEGEEVDDSYLGTFKDYYGESVYEPENDFIKSLALEARYIDDAEYLEWLNDDKMAKVLAEFPTRADLIDHLGPTLKDLADKYGDDPNLDLLINNMTYKSHPLAFYEFSQSNDFSVQEGDFGFRDWVRKGINAIKKIFTRNKNESKAVIGSSGSNEITIGDHSAKDPKLVSRKDLQYLLKYGNEEQKSLAQEILNKKRELFYSEVLAAKSLAGGVLSGAKKIVTGEIPAKVSTGVLDVSNKLSGGYLTAAGPRYLPPMHDPGAMLQGQTKVIIATPVDYSKKEDKKGKTDSEKIIENAKEKLSEGELQLKDVPKSKDHSIPLGPATDNPQVNAGLKKRPNDFSGSNMKYIRSNKFNNLVNGAFNLLPDLISKEPSPYTVRYKEFASDQEEKLKLARKAKKDGLIWDSESKNYIPVKELSPEEEIVNYIAKSGAGEDEIPEDILLDKNKFKLYKKFSYEKGKADARNINTLLANRYGQKVEKEESKPDYKKYLIPALTLLGPKIIDSILPPPPQPQFNPELVYKGRIKDLEMENENLKLKNQLSRRVVGDYSEEDVEDAKRIAAEREAEENKNNSVKMPVIENGVIRGPKNNDTILTSNDLTDNSPSIEEQAKAEAKRKAEQLAKEREESRKAEAERKEQEEQSRNAQSGENPGSNPNTDNVDKDSLSYRQNQLKSKLDEQKMALKAKEAGLKWNPETHEYENIPDEPLKPINATKEGIKNEIGEANWKSLSRKDRRELVSDARQHNKDALRQSLGIKTKGKDEDPIISLARDYLNKSSKPSGWQIAGQVVKGAGKFLNGVKDTVVALGSSNNQPSYRAPINGPMYPHYGYMSTIESKDKEGAKWE